MPRPADTPDVKASKSLAYILRHGAENEGLHIRSDGYIRLNDVLARPKMREVDKAMVLRLVEENAKKRFELFYGYDPSPPVVKKGKSKGKGKKGAGKNASVNAGSGGQPDTQAIAMNEVAATPGSTIGPDAASIDDIQASLASSSITGSSIPPGPTELPLISLPIPNDLSGSSPADELGFRSNGIKEHHEPPDTRGIYFIRASQGHSIKLDDAAHLEAVRDDEAGRKNVGLMVHGTKWELWDTLREQGLSRMQRQHIHLAPALTLSDHHITPRPSSTLLIYIDLAKLAQSGIPVYLSANGVILTPGNEKGVLGNEYFRLVERVKGGLQGKRTVIWKDGASVSESETKNEGQ